MGRLIAELFMLAFIIAGCRKLKSNKNTTPPETITMYGKTYELIDSTTYYE